MDNSSMTTLIIINLLLNFLQVLDHFLMKIKKSKCFGNTIEMNDLPITNNNNNQENIFKE
jgi:hypothetical protein